MTVPNKNILYHLPSGNNPRLTRLENNLHDNEMKAGGSQAIKEACFLRHLHSQLLWSKTKAKSACSFESDWIPKMPLCGESYNMPTPYLSSYGTKYFPVVSVGI